MSITSDGGPVHSRRACACLVLTSGGFGLDIILPSRVHGLKRIREVRHGGFQRSQMWLQKMFTTHQFKVRGFPA